MLPKRLYFSVDYDGCLAGGNVNYLQDIENKRSDWKNYLLYTKNKMLINFMVDKIIEQIKVNPDISVEVLQTLFKIIVGSNRQDWDTNADNGKNLRSGKNNGNCYPVILALSKLVCLAAKEKLLAAESSITEKQKINIREAWQDPTLFVDKYLLVDTERNTTDGDTFDQLKDLNVNDPQASPVTRTICQLVDGYKGILTCTQMVKACNANTETDFYFFDDRKDILDALKTFYTSRPALIPCTVNFYCYYHTQFNEITRACYESGYLAATPHFSIRGTGVVQSGVTHHDVYQFLKTQYQDLVRKPRTVTDPLIYSLPTCLLSDITRNMENHQVNKPTFRDEHPILFGAMVGFGASVLAIGGLAAIGTLLYFTAPVSIPMLLGIGGFVGANILGVGTGMLGVGVGFGVIAAGIAAASTLFGSLMGVMEPKIPDQNVSSVKARGSSTVQLDSFLCSNQNRKKNTNQDNDLLDNVTRFSFMSFCPFKEKNHDDGGVQPTFRQEQ